MRNSFISVFVIGPEVRALHLISLSLTLTMAKSERNLSSYVHSLTVSEKKVKKKSYAVIFNNSVKGLTFLVVC